MAKSTQIYINPELTIQNMAAAKKQTKQDLEAKIVELEAKLNKLSIKLESKSAESKSAEIKQKGTLPKGTDIKLDPAKPAERPVTITKPKGTLPKGFEEKPAEDPKFSETISQSPATIQDALENAYMTAPMTSFHDYRAKVTGYSPAPNRYFVRLTAPVGKVPTKNWNDQKAIVTGYTAASNQYFATRARMAYHSADKTFGSFSGINMTIEGVSSKT